MTDIENSKAILKKGNHTCVLCKGNTVYTSNKRGIVPLLDIFENNCCVNGFSAADKIVGKAAAMLFVKAGVSNVFAEVISQKAVEILQKNNIQCSWDTVCKCIVNRAGTGPCPIETAVMDVCDNDFDIAYQKILQRSNELRSQKNKE